MTSEVFLFIMFHVESIQFYGIYGNEFKNIEFRRYWINSYQIFIDFRLQGTAVKYENEDRIMFYLNPTTEITGDDTFVIADIIESYNKNP